MSLAPRNSRCRRLAGALCGLSALLALVHPASAAVVLAPQYAGAYAAGDGADATFLQIDSNWHGSTVLWNESTQTYGSGQPIGTFPWGTGLWGRADWSATQQSALGLGGPPIVNSWSGVVTSINFANTLYNTDYSATWGPASLVPFFNDSMPEALQEDWTSDFSGYIRIVDPGTYNFSVLNDDGFFFRLVGAGGSAVEIGRDFLNARDRDGFADNLLLSTGLYGFELGQWNRLEAGVVDLRWTVPGNGDWTLVPTTNLVSSSQVPEAGSLSLAALALALGIGLSRQGRSPPNAA